jgi:chromosomal replication initiation ATPase DnaA
MTNQLLLKFPSSNAYLKEDFYVSQSNNEAFRLIESWPKWIKKTVNIFGPKGSGKTHLISMLKNKTSTIVVSSTNITDKIFYEFKLKEVLIIENFKKGISENILYDIYNFAFQDNKYLVITSEFPINQYDFKLADLKSRVNSTTTIGIKLPSDELISVILSKNFSDKQIKVEKKHIDYIIKRIDRSYEKISQFISTIDKYSLKKSSPFSLKLIKEVLNMI